MWAKQGMLTRPRRQRTTANAGGHPETGFLAIGEMAWCALRSFRRMANCPSSAPDEVYLWENTAWRETPIIE